MGILIIGDVHLKTQEPYKSAIDTFFQWLKENYRDHTLIQLGDLYDISSPHNEIRKFVIQHLKDFKEVHIVTGNHDISKRSGNALTYLSEFDNITVYEDVTECKIEGLNFLMLPFKYNYQNEYSELAGEYDYVCTHITPIQCQFHDEGIEFPTLKGTFLHGHTHTQLDFIDAYQNKHKVVGVFSPTRHLEEKQNHRIFVIEPNELTEVQAPQYFTFETIEYGQYPSNKNNIINIKNAPDKRSVYEKYNNYFIRNEGITYKDMSKFSNDEITIFNKDEGFSAAFKKFAVEENIPNNIQSICIKYLEKGAM